MSVSQQTAMEELDDETRAALIDELHDLLQMDLDSSVISALWLSDIRKLREWVQKTRNEDPTVLPLLSGPSTLNMVLTWMSRTRPDSNSKKRKQGLSASDQASRTSSDSEGSSRAQMARSSSARDMCLDRDKKICLLTGVREPLQASHIYPYSLGKIQGTPAQRIFWSTMKLFWTEDRIQRWEEAVLGPKGSEICSNYVTFSDSVHSLWGRARFVLQPLDLSADKSSITVRFFWMPENQSFDKGQLHHHPPSTIDTHPGPIIDARTWESLLSGATFEFKTEDPVNLPLPSYDLLDMQFQLHRVAALSGAAQIAPVYDPDSDSECEGNNVESKDADLDDVPP